MKLSHAVWGHPRQTGHGGEVWQNVVHWRREWQTTSVFLPWEPYKQYEKAKNMILKDELPRPVGAQYATGDQWGNNSRKNKQMESNKNNTQMWMWLVIEKRSDAVKSNMHRNLECQVHETRQTEIILSFLRLHPSTAFWTVLLTMMATPFILSDSCPK